MPSLSDLIQQYGGQGMLDMLGMDNSQGLSNHDPNQDTVPNSAMQMVGLGNQPGAPPQSKTSSDLMNSLGLSQYNDPGSDQPPVPLKGTDVPPPQPNGVGVDNTKQASDDEDDDEPGDEEGNINKPSGNRTPASSATSSPKLAKSQQLADSLNNKDEAGPSFADAQHNAALATLGNQLGAAGNIIGSSLAMTPVNKAAAEQFQSQAADAGNIPKEYMQKKAMEEQDPNSAVSKNYRDFLAKQGLKVGEGVTAAQIRDVLLPTVEKENAQKEREQAAHDNKLLQYAQIKASKENAAAIRDQSRQDKLSKEDRDEADKILKEANGLTASSRSALGQATTSKQKVNRLVQLLNNPQATNEDLANAATDMNSVVAGTATIGGAKDQQYHSLKQDIAKGLQYISSNPQAPDVPQIKQHMIAIANEMSKISDDVQQHQLRTVKAGHSDFFKRRPEVVNGIIDAVQGNEPNEASPSGTIGTQPKSASTSNEVQRLDPKTGKTAIFDGSTKKFLRWAN